MKLKDLGVDSPEDRKLLMSTLTKAGYLNQQSPSKKKVVLSPEANVSHPLTKQTPAATSSYPTPMVSRAYFLMLFPVTFVTDIAFKTF